MGRLVTFSKETVFLNFELDVSKLLTWWNLPRPRVHYSLTLENGRCRAGVDLAITKAVVLPRWCLKTVLEVLEERRQHQTRSLPGWITFELRVYLKGLKP